MDFIVINECEVGNDKAPGLHSPWVGSLGKGKKAENKVVKTIILETQ